MIGEMIEVFKTNVQTTNEAYGLVSLLLQHFPGSRINFDLQDCDRILRIEGKDFCTNQVMLLVNKNGFSCEILE
jgi:hypothetical protein